MGLTQKMMPGQGCLGGVQFHSGAGINRWNGLDQDCPLPTPKAQTIPSELADVRDGRGNRCPAVAWPPTQSRGVKAFVESPSRIKALFLPPSSDSDINGWLRCFCFRMAIWAQNPGEEESGAVDMFHRRTRPKCCRMGEGRLIGSTIEQRNNQLVAVWAAKLEVPSVHGSSAAPMGTKMRTGNYHLGGGRGSRDGMGEEERERGRGKGDSRGQKGSPPVWVW